MRDYQPALIGKDADVRNSLIYNGWEVEGTVRNSILFPGVHVGPGAVVENSVIFFSNVIGRNCRFNKLISDVNTVYEDNIQIGIDHGDSKRQIAVVRWNNRVPAGTKMGRGVTVSPKIDRDKWPRFCESSVSL